MWMALDFLLLVTNSKIQHLWPRMSDPRLHIRGPIKAIVLPRCMRVFTAGRQGIRVFGLSTRPYSRAQAHTFLVNTNLHFFTLLSLSFRFFEIYVH